MICPKFDELRFVRAVPKLAPAGCPAGANAPTKFVWFAILNASKRASSPKRSRIRNVRTSEVSKLNMPGPRRALRPTLPYVPIGFCTNAAGLRN